MGRRDSNSPTNAKPFSVEVFKTNVQNEVDAERLIQKISQFFPTLRINFDLDDCDRILRVQDTTICNESISKIVSSHGYDVEILD
jgi:hypothetical protein